MCLLGTVSLELPFFLSYVTPRGILEIRHFVYRATRALAFMFVEDSYQ